jgi:ribonuclease R
MFLQFIQASNEVEPISVRTHFKPFWMYELCREVKKSVAFKFLLFHVIRVTANKRPPRITHMTKKKYAEGIVKRHPDGFGFLIPDQSDLPDIYIPKHSMKGVMSLDRVVAEVEPERGGERYRGEIVRVTVRCTKTVMGKFLFLNEKTGIIKDESNAWGEDLKVRYPDSMNAKPGEMVMAEITAYPDSGEFRGRVTEVLKNFEDPISDIKRVLITQQIPSVWPPEVLLEERNFSHNLTEEEVQRELSTRRDLRGKNLITIDGKTAKDFDDAVLVEMTDKGFLCFVAIADVSYYVRVGSQIDKEAYVRGTSVYFPNFVVPMLPEVLSNGLCSLNPHVPRFCLVAEMHFDFTGQKLSHQFYEAVMDSKARVTYGEAQDVIDGNESQHPANARDTILKCADLAKVLMAKRFREGSLDLEIPETELEIDGAGVPVDVVRSERLFAHRLIEELMLAANVAVAEFLSSRDVPAIYRIHEPPFEDALEILQRYLETFGSRAKIFGPGKLQKKLTKALEEFDGKPQAQLLNILTLRSMKQAQYSPHNVGHFGLGFENYTHFTSPIRRYPDLIVHRLLKNQIMQNSAYRLMSLEDLETAGTMLSACEQRAAKSERQIKAIKKARFMQKFIGREFDGMISGVTKFGAFVLLREYDIDGLIRMGDLAKEPLEYDEDNLRLVARRSGLSYSIGDEIRIRVVDANVELGQIDFELASAPVKKEDPKKAVKHMPVYERMMRGEGLPFHGNKGARFGKEEAEGGDGEGSEKKFPFNGKKFKPRYQRGKKNSSEQKVSGRADREQTGRADGKPTRKDRNKPVKGKNGSGAKKKSSSKNTSKRR